MADTKKQARDTTNLAMVEMARELSDAGVASNNELVESITSAIKASIMEANSIKYDVPTTGLVVQGETYAMLVTYELEYKGVEYTIPVKISSDSAECCACNTPLVDDEDFQELFDEIITRTRDDIFGIDE